MDATECEGLEFNWWYCENRNEKNMQWYAFKSPNLKKATSDKTQYG